MNRGLRMTFLMVMLCTLLLTGCGKKTIRGEVVAVNTDGFVLDQDIGGQVTVYTDEDTFLFSFIDDLSTDDLRDGNVDGMMVSVVGRKAADGFNASQVRIMNHKIRDYCTLSDGTKVDLITGIDDNVYCLGNITELLRVRKPVGPENVSIVGSESLDFLPEEAQQKILAYYDAQGLLYDEMGILEEAYYDFCHSDKFYAYFLSQEVLPTASGEDVIYFMTDYISDLGKKGTTQLRMTAAFDRKTGSEIPVAELFTCKPEEIVEKLAEISGEDDRALIEEMKLAFKPEYLVFFPNSLEIEFPEESLPQYGISYGMGIDFENEQLRELLQSWAIPVSHNPQ